MNGWLLTIVGAIYAYVAGVEAAKGNWGMVLVFTSYALANIGFMVALK